MPMFDKLNHEEYAKGKMPSISKLSGNSGFLEVHVSTWNYLEFQVMEMAEDGAITLKESGSFGVRGKWPKQIVNSQETLILYTDLSGDL
jgi:hypothetical protein